ncbi:MAG: DEAD/DEAH box helicase [Chlamydiales bacterium]
MNQEAEIPNGFAEFGLDPMILKALEKMKFNQPSPIQKKTIPLIQEHKDLIGLSQTGSGKTAACAIPVCNRVIPSQRDVQTLILVPTRELCLQYATEVQKIGHYKGVQALAVFGGKDADVQQSKLRHGVQVLVATPGRLIDFIYSRQIDLSHVTTLIIDEADEMLSMGFFDDLDFIIQCLVQKHQTLLFSATMSAAIRKLAQQYMREPLEINLTVDEASPQLLEHLFAYCQSHHRDEELIRAINETHPVQAIIFCQSRSQVEKVCQTLKRACDGVDFLHAGLTQDVRTIITNKFRQKKIRFLVATDIAARGLDFSHVSHVFIYHLPSDPEIYVHRSGRTGRYGKSGIVISLVTKRELGTLQQILKQIKQPVKWVGPPPPSDLEMRQVAKKREITGAKDKGYKGQRTRGIRDTKDTKDKK